MWVAKNKNGNIKIFINKPIRSCSINSVENDIWVDVAGYDNETSLGLSLDTISKNMVNYISWNSEPEEVNIFSNNQIKDIICATTSLAQEDYYISLEEIISRFKTYIRLDLSFLINW